MFILSNFSNDAFNFGPIFLPICRILAAQKTMKMQF